MAKIHVLDKHVAELIAAGEVVERPASVMKELMENTIDAGAHHVTVEIRNGGITYMRITDDGCGIQREDVAVAFLRHATSKVLAEEDLNAIETLGFRGEALASIAAVSRVELTTCAAGETVGTHYVICGGEEQCIEDCGCADGTTIVVQDLFYNVPARMKFLKKDVSEGNAVAGVVERLALSHPEVAVDFIRDGRDELHTPGDGSLRSCIYAVLGKPFSAGMIPVEYTMGGIGIRGFVCRPDACRQNRTMQHFFVNGRYVKTQTAMVALERAYKGVIMVGRFPTCVLFLTMPAETVDANVHPAKIEIRFINEKPVFNAVYYGVRSALEQGGKRIGNVQLPVPHPLPLTEKSAPVPVPPAPKQIPEPASVPAEPPVSRQIRQMLDIVVDDKPVLQKTPVTVTDAPVTGLRDSTERPGALPVQPVYIQAVPKERPTTPVSFAPATTEQLTLEKEPPAVRLLGQIFETYILAEMEDALFVIDKHAAHERILYNQLKSTAHEDAQMLLAPLPVSLSRDEYAAIIDNTDVLLSSGIEIEDFGGNTVLVRTFPMILSGTDIEGTIREIAGGLAGGSREVNTNKLDWIYHSAACRAAIKAGDHSRPVELQDIAEQVLLHEDVRYCPHGRPVCIRMTRRELEKQFGRLG